MGEGQVEGSVLDGDCHDVMRWVEVVAAPTQDGEMVKTWQCLNEWMKLLRQLVFAPPAVGEEAAKAIGCAIPAEEYRLTDMVEMAPGKSSEMVPSVAEHCYTLSMKIRQLAEMPILEQACWRRCCTTKAPGHNPLVLLGLSLVRPQLTHLRRRDSYSPVDSSRT